MRALRPSHHLVASVVRHPVVYLSNGGREVGLRPRDLCLAVCGTGGPDGGHGLRAEMRDVQVDAHLQLCHDGEDVALDARSSRTTVNYRAASGGPRSASSDRASRMPVVRSQAFVQGP